MKRLKILKSAKHDLADGFEFMFIILKGLIITVFVAVVLNGLVGLFFDGVSGATSAAIGMLFYWYLYVGIGFIVGVIGFVYDRRAKRKLQGDETD
ncbi:MAG: hypothetical protein ACI8QI_000600 [Limisphaerales bacterium]|jgi:hypothetical protein